MSELIRKQLTVRFKIKRHEQNKLLWSLLLAFTTGFLQCYVSAIPMAMFLEQYSSTNLPVIYLAVALLSFVLGLTYGVFETRLNLKWLSSGLVLVIALVLTVVGLLLITHGTVLLIGFLTVWAVLSYELFSFAIWSVFNSIFNIQQAKKWFGIISGSQKIGGLIGGLLTPLIVIYISLDKLIFLVGCGIFGLVFIILLLWKNIHAETILQDEEPDEAETKTSFAKSLLRDSYICKIALLFILAVFTTYIIDLMFVSIAAEHYPKTAALAGFLGLFFGLADGIDLLTSVLFLSVLLKRFGVICTLALYPLLGGLFSIIILIFLPMTSLFMLFILISMLKLCEESIKSSLTDMGHLLLLQPFHPRLRALLKSKIDLLVVGFATGFISVLLLILTHYFGVSIPLLAALVLLCFMLTLLILWTIRSKYVNALAKALTTRYFEKDLRLQFSKEDLQLFQGYLFSPHPDEVIFAVNAIEKIDLKEFNKALNQLMLLENSKLAEFSLEKIKEYKLKQNLPSILEYLEINKCDSFEAKLLDTAASLDFNKVQPLLKKFISCKSNQLARTAFIIPFKYGKSKLSKDQFDYLVHMAASDDKNIRVDCAFIIGEIKQEKINILLEKLVEDNNFEVRKEAFIATIKSRYHPLYNKLLLNLSKINLSCSMVNDFSKINDIFKMIVDNFDRYSDEIKLKALYLLKQMNNKKSINFIAKIFIKEKGYIQEMALEILSNKKEVIYPPLFKVISEKIIEYTDILQHQYQQLTQIPLLPETQLIRDVLKRKMQTSETRLFYLLEIYYDNLLISKIKNGIHQPSEDEKSYALELLDNCLNATHKKRLSSLLNSIYLEELPVKSDLHSPSFHAVLRENMQLEDRQYVSLLSAMASCYVIIKKNIVECEADLVKIQALNIPLLQETMAWLQQAKVD